MNYELLNTIDVGADIWPTVKKRVKKNHATVLTLAAFPAYGGILAKEGLKGVNIVDLVTKRTYHADNYRFFNRVRVPYTAKVEMNDDQSINIIYEGEPIAREFLFPNARRATQDVRFNNSDGTLDYIEEYAADGTLFSNIFYTNNQIQEIVFYDLKERPVLRYYYYENNINYITIEDPVSHKVQTSYDTLPAFLQDQVAKLVDPEDTVTFSYLGIELESLMKTKSHNIIQMAEPPLDESHNLRGNLRAILTNDIPYVQEVRMSLADFQQLGTTDAPMRKVKIG